LTCQFSFGALKQQYLWNTGLRSHLITVEEINVDGDTGHSWAGFSVFHTDSEGSTKLYAVGAMRTVGRSRRQCSRRSADHCNASDGTNLMLELFQYDDPWDNQLEIVEYWRQTFEDKGPVRICRPE